MTPSAQSLLRSPVGWNSFGKEAIPERKVCYRSHSTREACHDDPARSRALLRDVREFLLEGGPQNDGAHDSSAEFPRHLRVRPRLAAMAGSESRRRGRGLPRASRLAGRVDPSVEDRGRRGVRDAPPRIGPHLHVHASGKRGSADRPRRRFRRGRVARRLPGDLPDEPGDAQAWSGAEVDPGSRRQPSVHSGNERDRHRVRRRDGTEAVAEARSAGPSPTTRRPRPSSRATS
jgi:hypothetical protein